MKRRPAGALGAGAAASVLTLAALAPAAGAQAAPVQRSSQRPGPELRADAALGRHPAALVGAGLLVDAGLYVRLGVLAAAGVASGSGHGAPRTAGAAAEVAGVARFLLDPLRQEPRGLYVGGGVGVRAADGARDPFLLAVVGVEGRRRGGTAPAVEVGVGGGLRLAVVLRRARADRR